MTDTFAITPRHMAAFERDGVLRLPGFYPAEILEPMADAIWADLRDRYGVDRRRRETWLEERPTHFQSLGRSGAFAQVNSPDLYALTDGLLGRGRWRAIGNPTPLITFPTGFWDLPCHGWHVDTPTDPDAPRRALSSLRSFILLARVAPRSGGTLYVAGSHRVLFALAAEAGVVLRSPRARDCLRRESAWFDMLWTPAGSDRIATLMDHGAIVRGIAVRVEEMIGEAGDLILMHPTLLHSVAPNESDRPRMALAHSAMRTV
jgi:hypothetical protein